MICNDDNDELAGQGRSSICRSNVLNLGDKPRVLAGGNNTDGTATSNAKEAEGQTLSSVA
jgi:hypothetical protein